MRLAALRPVVCFLFVAACSKPSAGSAGVLVVELLPTGVVTADGANVADGGLRGVIETTKTDESVVLSAAAETRWRAMQPLLDASRGRLASTGFVLAVRGEAQRRTSPIGGPGAAKLRPPPAVPPAGGPAAGEPGSKSALHLELRKDGAVLVDNAAVTRPLGPRLDEVKDGGTDVAIVMPSDDDVSFGAVVDLTREVQAEGLAVAYGFGPRR